MKQSEALPRVLLINPAWTRVPMRKLAALPDLYPPMGLGCVASALRAAGFDVAILDMPVLEMPYDDVGLVEAVAEFKPDIVGFTTVTITWPIAVRQAKAIRERWPDLPLIVGGVHVTSAPELIVLETAFDYSVIGEGEAAAVALCRGIYSGQVQGDIPGVGYHRLEKPRFNQPSDVDLTEYPPTAYDLFRLDLYLERYERMSIMTSRGCSSSCAFCSTGHLLPAAKFLPLCRIFSELEFLVRDIGFRFINIYDANFTQKKVWVHQICDEIIARNLRFHWRCFCRTTGVDIELFSKMRTAGCTHVLFGVESSHDVTLAKINKRTSRHHIKQAFVAARTAGLNRVAYSIVGLPGEDRRMVLETIDFLEELDAEWNVVSPICLQPGTPLQAHSDKFRMVIDNSDATHSSRGEATVSNTLLSAVEINELCDIALTRLNGASDAYHWHRVVSTDPSTCPHVALMELGHQAALSLEKKKL